MRLWWSCAIAATLCACAGGSPASVPRATVLHAFQDAGAGKIKHVIWVIQENRSLDNVFMGYPGADTVSSGKDSKGKTVKLRPISLKKVSRIYS